LRHVSEAFVEDPVRILRVARFAARFGFTVSEPTMQLMKKMVDSGEADYLVPERVWQEFSKGLAESEPGKMFEVLERCGLSQKWGLGRPPAALAESSSVPVRFTLLTWPLSEAQIKTLCERLRVPNDVRELALAASKNRKLLQSPTPVAMLALLKGADAFRRPERFAELLEAARLAEPAIDVARIERALKAAAAVDAGAIAKSAQGADIGRRLDDARLQAIKGLY
jgi:tRNA nucleotidyltransferase (CCA-adding enzyme)